MTANSISAYWKTLTIISVNVKYSYSSWVCVVGRRTTVYYDCDYIRRPVLHAAKMIGREQLFPLDLLSQGLCKSEEEAVWHLPKLSTWELYHLNPTVLSFFIPVHPSSVMEMRGCFKVIGDDISLSPLSLPPIIRPQRSHKTSVERAAPWEDSISICSVF